MRPRTWSWLVLALAAGGSHARNSAGEDIPQLVSSRIRDRVVRSFDFDEQKLGNFESMPRHWRPVRGPGFPRFLEAGFDFEVGRSAPPSLRLPVAGGSLAVTYQAADINVHPGCDYRITGWIRPRGLVHAGASVTTFFLDHALRPIEASVVRSGAVRGRDGPWVQVSLLLPGGFPQARWIGLRCQVEQPSPADTAAGELVYHDTAASAWFDDISVLRLPAVALDLNSAIGVFRAEEPAGCLVKVGDLDGRGLSAELRVVDADGRLVEIHQPGVEDQQGTRIRFGRLPPGAYLARLRVMAGGEEVIARERRFIQLGDLPPGDAGTDDLGIILDAEASSQPEVATQLVRMAGSRRVKVPLWRSRTSDEVIVAGDPGMDRLLRDLAAAGRSVVGVLDGPPTSLATRLGRPGLSLAELLASRPEQWRPYLALVLTRYGHEVSGWQVGSDLDPARADELPGALGSIRSEVHALLGTASLVAPLRAMQADAAVASADVRSLAIPPEISSERLAAYLHGGPSWSGGRRWATIEPLEPGRYPRVTALSELARKFIIARQAGMESIFISQPWRIHLEHGREVVSPDESLVVARTLSGGLGNLRPAGPIWLDHGIRGYLFEDGRDDGAVVAAWTIADTEAARRITLPCTPETTAHDLHGNRREPQEPGSFAVGPAPLLIGPVSARQLKAQAGFGMEGGDLQASVNRHHRTIHLANPGPGSLRGALWLRPPPGWSIEPKKLAIDLPPGGRANWPIRIRVPVNEAEGDYRLSGVLRIDSADGARLALGAPIRVVSPEVDVNVLVRGEGDGLRVIHRVTNTSGQSLSLRSVLVCGDRPRQSHSIPSLAQGQTVTREYLLPGAASLAGQFLRASIEQVGGPLRQNRLIRLE